MLPLEEEELLPLEEEELLDDPVEPPAPVVVAALSGSDERAPQAVTASSAAAMRPRSIPAV